MQAGWAGLGWAGLGWAGLGWAGRAWQAVLLAKTGDGSAAGCRPCASSAGPRAAQHTCEEHSKQCDVLAGLQGTILGILSAGGAELSILKCATRVVAADGAHILSGGYRKCAAGSSVGGGSGSGGQAGALA